MSLQPWSPHSTPDAGLVAKSCLTLATLWTVAPQAPLSMGSSRQEYWSWLPCPPPQDLSNPGIKPGSPAMQADSLPSEPSGKPSGSQRSHFLQGVWVPSMSFTALGPGDQVQTLEFGRGRRCYSLCGKLAGGWLQEPGTCAQGRDAGCLQATGSRGHGAGEPEDLTQQPHFIKIETKAQRGPYHDESPWSQQRLKCVQDRGHAWPSLSPGGLLSYLIFTTISSVQSLSHVWLFATPWIAAHRASWSFTISWSLLILISIGSVMPSYHLILCRPLLLLRSFPTIFHNNNNAIMSSSSQRRKCRQGKSEHLAQSHGKHHGCEVGVPTVSHQRQTLWFLLAVQFWKAWSFLWYNLKV